MSSVTASSIQVSGLGKAKMQALRSQAKAAGVTTEVYAKRLIEEAISLEQQARTRTFDELYAPAQERFRRSGMDEEDLDKLVDAARPRHHQRTAGKQV